jgi:hypothetical protein
MNTWSTFFPAKPRHFPCRRGLRTLLRALHILTTGVLLGGHVFNQSPDSLQVRLLGSIVTGMLLLATDLYASCALIFEVRGVVVLVNLFLLLLVPFMWDYRVSLLVAILVIGAVSSHMPGNYRHRLLFFNNRLTVDERRG